MMRWPSPDIGQVFVSPTCFQFAGFQLGKFVLGRRFTLANATGGGITRDVEIRCSMPNTLTFSEFRRIRATVTTTKVTPADIDASIRNFLEQVGGVP